MGSDCIACSPLGPPVDGTAVGRNEACRGTLAGPQNRTWYDGNALEMHWKCMDKLIDAPWSCPVVMFMFMCAAPTRTLSKVQLYAKKKDPLYTGT